MSQQLQWAAEILISAGLSHVKGPAELNEMVQYGKRNGIREEQQLRELN